MFNLKGMKNAPFENVEFIQRLVLMEDDRAEILTTGRNRLGERVIASLILTEEDEHDPNHDTEYYFYLLPSVPCFAQFAIRNLPYRALFDTTDEIYVVAQHTSDRSPVVYRVTRADIPHDYLPTFDSFLPLTVKTLLL